MKKIKNLLAAVLITSILFSSNAISYAADTAEGNRNEIGQETSVQAEAAVETEAETAKKAEATEEKEAETVKKAEATEEKEAEKPEATEEKEAEKPENPEAAEDEEAEKPEKAETTEEVEPEKPEIAETAEDEKTEEPEKPEAAEDEEAENPEKGETTEEVEPEKPEKAETAEDEKAENPEKTETTEEAESEKPEKAETTEEAESEKPEKAETTEETDAEKPGKTENAAEGETAAEAKPPAETEAQTAEETAADPEVSAAATTEQPAAEETFTAGELSYKGSGYSVTLSYDADAKIPADAGLKVREIKRGTSEYDSYLKSAAAASDKGVADARFFDITIWSKGQEIQPQSAVRVNISYNKAIEVADQGEVTAMHFEDGSGNAEVLDTDTKGGSKVSEIAFDAESFSVYGIIYSVDFTYEGFTFTMPGEGSVLLSILAGELDLYEKDYDKAFSIDNVNKVEFTDYDLVKIEKQADGDWLLTSLASFESKETLTITMEDGVKFVIAVTDPPETRTQTSSDLTNFLTKVIIQGATQNSDGTYVVKQGTDYSLIANFAESTEYQFRNNADLTYQMPQGIAILSEQAGPFKINIVYRGRTYEVDASYRLTTGGQLTVKFDENDPDYSKLVSSTDVRFRFTYSAQFDGSATEIKFNDVVERDIVFDEPEPGQAYVSKTAQYDEKTGRFTYTIKVTAVGDVTDVHVKDIISGDALSINNDVSVTGNSTTPVDHHAEKGFDYTFPSMADGEEITITYSANVDFFQDTDKDGKITADQTRNTVTVEPEGGEPHKAEYQREISFRSTSKSKGDITGTAENGDKIVDWKILYNPLAVAPAAKTTITDTIAGESVPYMTYYGDGLTVNVYDPDGSLVRTDKVNYDDLTEFRNNTWTYTIPESDTQPYSYEITYQTIVNMKKINDDATVVTLINDANGSGQSIVVTPDSQIGVRKDIESFNTGEVSWISTISVPENGLAQAVATDTLPHVYLHDRFIYDTYKGGSLDITGLENGETYDVTYSTDKVVITFYKDAGKTQSGLQAVEGGHTITVRLTTNVDREWLKAGYDGGETEPDWTTYLMNHTNTFALNTVTDTATVVFDKPGMEKSAEIFKDGQGKVSRILYSLLLSGVSDTPVSIEDTFDTSILEIDKNMSGEWDHFRIWGGNHDAQIAGHLPVSYSETANGVLITANSIPMQPGGSYYSHYKISYYLKLRDGIDLDQLAVANGGEYDLVNTATWDGHESSFTYKTEYDYLDKQLLNEGELGGKNRTAKYRITFNGAQAVLNGGEPMEMTDTLSANLSIDYGSVSITTVPENETVSYSLRGGDDGETIATYTIPDATKVVIEYDALVIGNGQQTIVNKVSVNGKDETVESTKEYGSASEGEGAIASFKIVKVDGYNAGKKLSGVKFRLFSEKGLYFDDENTVSEVFLTTDENGEAFIDGNAINIYFNEVYHLQEVEEADGYGKIGFDYKVTLTNDMSLVDYPHFIYYFSDSMQIKNWPLEGLVVEKQVESDEQEDLDRYYNFRLSILKDDGTVDTDYNEKNGDDQFENGIVEFELKSGEQKMFRGFEKGTKYKVEEILTDDEGNMFTTTVSYYIFDEEGDVVEHRTETGTSHSGELTQEDETLVFTNTRSETGSLKIKKNVTVNGESTIGTLADGTYTFTITGPGEDGEVEKTVEITVENGTAISAKVDGKDAELDSGGYVEVTDLEAGQYTVTETAPANGTALMTDNNIVLTVEAGKTGEDVPEAAIGSFTNNYAVGSAVLSAKKAANASLGDTEFRFELLNAAGNIIETSDPVKQGGTAAFTPIEYTLEDVGEYTYTIREEIPEGVDENNKLNGITYDTHEKTVTVKVEAAGDGTLAITYDGDPSFQAEEFSNTYAAEGEISLHATKKFTGRDWTEDDQFEFTLAADPENPEGAELPEKTTATATKDEQTVTFDKIRFTNPGEYTFTITETDGGLGGVTYDSEPKTIKVTVIDNLDGTLTAVADPKNATVTAKNTYAAEGEISLHAAKEFTGRDWTENDKFEFTLAADPGNPKGATLPEKTTATATKDEQTVTFDKIRFTKPGEYTFTITETDGSLGGVTYDTEPKTVKVTVTDNLDGTLTAVADPDNATVTAKNTYAAEGEISLHAAKEFTGRDWTEDDKFEFTLAADPENPEGATLPEKTTATATKDEQTVTFDKIRFTKPGEYTFTITETDGGLGGVTYDTEPKTVKVTVTDNLDGTLTAVADPNNATVTAKNTYAAEGEISLHAAKEFTGRDWTEDDQFEFTLAADPENPEGAELPEKTTATATKDEQTVTFDKIRFTKAGEYTFTITETDGGLGGVTYDTEPKTIKITVTDNLDGTLTAVADPDNATVTAKNTYAAEGEISLHATKEFTGRDWTEDDSFEFTLAADPENPEGAELPEKTAATATKDEQTVTFDKIRFTKAGEYTFTITETDGGLGGVTYDTEPKTIKVTVTDNLDGTLTAVADPNNATVTAKNTYAAEGEISLHAAKEFTGRDWTEDDKFEFTLAPDPENPEGAELPEKTTATATKDEQTVTFDKIRFTKPGTYKFTITETKGDLENVAFDTAPKTITVTVTDNNDGTLTAVPTPDTATVTAHNVYNASGEISLGAEKVLAGRDWTENDKFEFTLAADENNPEGAILPDTVVKTATRDARTVTFDPIKFKKEGDYIFTITETDGGLSGVTYDTAPKTIRVSVTKSGDGTLTAKADPESAKVTVENTYEAEGEISLHATKKFTGRDWTENDKFEFTLAADPENPEGATLPEKTTATATKDEQTVTFDKISFTKPGEYTFTITETDGGLGGVTYDTEPKTVKVTVTDNLDGTLTAVADPNNATVTAKNTYAAEGEISLHAAKEFTGRDWTENDKFEFTLAADPENPEGAELPEKTTAVAKKDEKTVTFDKIRFTKPGEYTFTITETDGGLGGVTYDTEPKTIKVTVTDNLDGTLSAVADPDNATVTAKNTYAAKGEISLHAAKEFTGRDWTEDDSFEFTLAADSENPEGAELPEKTTATATKDEQTVTFDKIRFTKAGEYTFTITETDGGLGGVTYDTEPKIIRVKVTNDGNKTLTVKADPESAKVTVENTYAAEGEISLHAAKKFTGRDWTEDDKFEFTLAADPENPEGATLPEKTTATATKDEQTVTFDKISFTKPGEYTFTITETDGGLGGVTYDTEPKTVKVTVTDNLDGTLTAVADPNNATVTAKNTYAAEGEIRLHAAKEFTGRDWTEDDSFEFTLAADSENPEGAELPEKTAATATKDEQTVTFDKIRFTKAGTYKFTITETKGDLENVAYDTAPKTITVTVTDNNDGTLTAVPTPDTATVTAHNVYNASGEISLGAEKVLKGRDWKENDKFEFTLAADENNPEGAILPDTVVKTATRDARTVTFDPIKFKKAGDYIFTITETDSGLAGVTYDTAPKTIRVSVTKSGDGTLTAKADPESAKVTVENTYAAEGEISLLATKEFTGRDWTENDKFEFTLAADPENPEGATLPEKTTATASKDEQTVTFDEIRFTKPGEYTFTITETDGGLGGVTYDTEPKTVKVTVTDNLDGTLSAVADPNNATVTAKNTYAAEGEISLHATKKFTGRDWTENDKFEFTLAADPENPEGATLPEKTTATASKDEQTVTFDEIRFTKPGEYTFTITETDGSIGGVTYDTEPKTVKVTVTDNLDGTLSAVADPNNATVTAKNTYAAEGEISLHAAKEFTGRDWTEDDKFEFTLAADPENPEGAELPEKTTATATKDEQTVTFDKIRFTKAGTYKFTITETKGDLENVTYDTAPKTITVTVTDNNDGTLTAVADPKNATVTAKNTYAAAGTLKLDAEKTFKNGVLQGGEFTFELKDADGKILQSKKNDVDGKVSFDVIAYTPADVAKAPYTYTVSEVTGTNKNVKYDQTIYTVTVSLKDKGNGELEVTKEIDNGGKLKFMNEQLEAETSIEIGGVKVFKGQDLKADQFKFVMVDENGKTIRETRNEAGGNFTFEKITYKLSDLGGSKQKVYTYNISEVKGSDKSIIYDKKIYTVTVTVTYNDEKLTATASKKRAEIRFVNDVTKVQISKIDISTNKELPGAKLSIIDKDGKTVESWTSGKEPHMIGKLRPGVYTLHEVTAPDGYEVAKDVKFTVKETGEIQKVTMADAPKETRKHTTTTRRSGRSPRTGDTSNIFVWVLLLAFGSLMFGAVWYMKKKAEKDTNQR